MDPNHEEVVIFPAPPKDATLNWITIYRGKTDGEEKSRTILAQCCKPGPCSPKD